ncbi:MAG: DegT/DnrJ/EryC1/StrS family aminotransferase [Candidatus Omnitrophota bacterium]
MNKVNKICYKPAIFGGRPVFKKMLPIIKPTLPAAREVIADLKNIFLSGSITCADYVQKFEGACARYLGVKHAIATSSATAGLMLAIKGLGLKGEVIVPSFTFTATVHALIWYNLIPVFVDCEKETFNIDVRMIEEKITSRTAAIMPVYIFGNPPEIKKLQEIARKNNLKLIFDSAQAFGAEYQGVSAGRFGDCEVFSLSPTKVLTAVEGGLVATNNDKLAEFLKKARDYGKSNENSDIEYVGLSARMSELHALVGLKNLENAASCLKTRHDLIGLYKQLLKAIEGISFQKISAGNKSSGNYMVIFIDKRCFGMSRDELYRALQAENIQTKKYFYPAVHQQKAYAKFRPKYQGKLPITEKAAREGLAMPLYGHMSREVVEKVCLGIKRIHEHINSNTEQAKIQMTNVK